MGTDTQVDHPIIFFDGVCNLCNNSVDLIVRNDSGRHFRFASLQSSFAETFLRNTNHPADQLDSIILAEGTRIFTRSSAAVRIARRMDGLWKVVYLAIWVPRPIRDALYDLVARNRYRWFGKKNTCRIPKPEEFDRFLG